MEDRCDSNICMEGEPYVVLKERFERLSEFVAQDAPPCRYRGRPQLFSGAIRNRSMDTTPHEWDRLLVAANAGDGFAIDHIVEARLRGTLPAALREANEDQCFLMWSRDGEYCDDVKEAAAAHDPSEPSAFRDEDVSVLDVRFVDTTSTCSFMGLGVDGCYDINISFHPRSSKPIRVLLREEESEAADDEQDVYEKSKMWEASGYKLIREWTPRSKVASARTRTSFDGRQPTKAHSDNFKGRSVVYTIKTLTERAQGKPPAGSSRGAEADLDVHFGIREPMPDAEDPSPVAKIATSARIVPRQKKGCSSVRIRSTLRIATNAGACSLVDCDSGVQREGGWCNWQFGAHRFECGRSAVQSAGMLPSELRSNSLWLLSTKPVRTMTIVSDNEVSDATEEDKRGIKSKLSRLFSDERAARPPLTSHKSLEVSIASDVAFIDRLEKQGILRRVRKNNASWNKSQADDLKARRASLVASARF